MLCRQHMRHGLEPHTVMPMGKLVRLDVGKVPSRQFVVKHTKVGAEWVNCACSDLGGGAQQWVSLPQSPEVPEVELLVSVWPRWPR